MKIDRPRYESVPLKRGLRWPGGNGWHCTEKMDGVFAVREMLGAVFIGEAMRDGSFHAFDLVNIGGEDITRRPLRERWQALQTFRQRGVAIVPAGGGGEFLEFVLANGGEGIVAAEWSAPYGAQGARLKCKRRETFDCVITGIGPGESIAISEGDVDRGRCPVVGGKLIDGWDYRPRIAALNVGDVVEVACQSIHASGKFREARFVRTRKDKHHA